MTNSKYNLNFHMDNKLKREIGYFETVNLLQRNTVITIAEITGHNFDIVLLKKALDAVVNFQPNLRINADELTYPMQFKEIHNPYIYPNLIESDNPNEWKILAHSLMNIKLPVNLTSTLFKFTILKIKNQIDGEIYKTYFYLQLGHSISDGTSGMILLHNILSFYTNFSSGEDYVIDQVEFLPNIEKLAYPHGINEENEKVINEKIEIIVKDIKNNLTLVKPCVMDKENTHYSILEDGTEENFIKLKKFSKENNITIGNVIIAAYYFATAKLGHQFLEDQDIFNIPVTIDINLRDRLDKKLERNHVALLISINKIYIQFQRNTSFIELCKEINRKVKEFLTNKEYLYEMEANRILSEKYLKAKDNSEFDITPSCFAADLNLSNIGSYPFNSIYKLKDGEIKVKSLKCIGSPWSPKYSHYLFLIHSVDYMNYSMVYTNKESEEYANKYIRLMIDLIEKCYDIQKMTFEEYLHE